ncbi:hypothetical protein K470DRAFT_256269 [Piedraia hortae CBS 480.64]|uniref:RNase H type-1 domain-containing protein n=1 Tax=Piedraia hortae CBS 480.64 TaxID=1314780 RepID=A0A6A7C427_9PEZI|nr:hypothetical protein K470DRAFT_256269 [Piedraia hortae CBS 480.64]
MSTPMASGLSRARSVGLHSPANLIHDHGGQRRVGPDSRGLRCGGGWYTGRPKSYRDFPWNPHRHEHPRISQQPSSGIVPAKGGHSDRHKPKLHHGVCLHREPVKKASTHQQTRDTLVHRMAGHNEISGNDCADELAKEVALLFPDKPSATLAYIRRTARCVLQKNLQNRQDTLRPQVYLEFGVPIPSGVPKKTHAQQSHTRPFTSLSLET